MNRRLSFSRDGIKYFAAFTMLLNHIGNCFFMPGTAAYEILTDIGYFTAVTMCFFLVEGYGRTRSRVRYGLRLGIFALIAEIPYCLAFSSGTVIRFYGLDMLFTLLLCFFICAVYHSSLPRALRLPLIALLSLLSLPCDWPIFAPVFTLLFLWAGNDREKLRRAFAADALCYGLIMYCGYLPSHAPLSALLHAFGSVLGILLSGAVILRLYDGRRCRRGQRFSKWFFYCFYPLHLLLLGLLRIHIML